jgi:hypothetical protein
LDILACPYRYLIDDVTRTWLLPSQTIHIDHHAHGA